jgi:hypothetical protein
MTRRLFVGIALFALLAPLSFADGPGGGGSGKGGGGGSGGGGGTQPAPNPLVGMWVGGELPTGGPFRYQFDFKKDFTYTLVETDSFTGVTTASFAGTYTLGGVGPDGFPVLTMVQGGEVIFQAELDPKQA